VQLSKATTPRSSTRPKLLRLVASVKQFWFDEP
jgi:hypothetical protein